MDPRVQVIRDVGLAVGSATPSLDGFHRPVSFGDVVTGIWSINYDAEDRLTRLQSPTGDVTEIHYDAVGNTSDIMEPGGRISHFEYDERDALVQAQWPSGDVSRYEYLCKCQAGGATKIGSRGVIQLMSADLRRVVA
jgi:YD repeat-containing protein